MADVLRTIGTIARALDSIANIEFREIDLARGQYVYLARICEAPSIIQEQLVNQLKVDRATVARSVQKLEQHGFVERRADESNQKIKRLFPTNQGLDVYQTIKAENDYSTSVSVSGMTADEKKILESLLEKMSDNIDASWQQVKSGKKRDY